ncbi:hypothetical protein KAU39_05240 [bacterium]|nr:hypothetical protein [bacterium]
MPIKVKLSEVDPQKVRKALSQAKEVCSRCSLEKKHCETCFVNIAVLALQSFLKEKDFDMSIDWKVLSLQHQPDRQKLLILLETLEDICLHCGILHIDECFINISIQVIQLLLFGKIIPREYDI